ncbi:MAG: TonB-dependent receptor [Verrucomicrobia bacterium]|nr:TonB-dependent receptor [Verrucomicrobiota bacterium]
MNQSLLAAARAAACLGAFALLCGAPVPAQTASTPTVNAAGAAEPEKLEKFEVTGSLIKRTDAEGPSPVRFITREDIDLSGMDNLTDIMRDIPEATALGINEGGTTTAVRGASAIDLRFLGPNNTLVLVDGRRQAPNGISSGGTVFVDLNRIPVSLIERVELLKDGASAVYGSDATAGVINIITRQNFVGAEVNARYGNYFNTDGSELSVSLFGGTRAGKLRANVTYSYSSRHANAATDQPFSANADQTERWRAYDAVKYANNLRPTATAVSAYDGRSGTGPYATVGVPTLAQLTDPKNGFTAAAIVNPLTGTAAAFLPGTGGVNAGTLGSSGSYASVPRENNPGRPTAAQFVARAYPAGEFSNSYNFQPFVWNVPERVTRSLSTGLAYQLTRTIEADAAVTYTQIKSETHLAPSPISTAGDNNILVPARNYYNPFGIPLAFTYRPIEVGPRIAKIQSKSLGVRAGIHGSLAERFDWDLGWAYTKNESTDRTTNAISESKVRAALAKTTPDALNIFGGPGFKNDPATIDGIKVISGQNGDADTLLLDGRITTTELFALPWGKVGSSLSAQHREEHFNTANDALSTTLDDIIGQVRLADPTKASRTVDSAAFELRLPLVKEKHFRFVHTLEVNGATRFEKFSDGYDSGIKPFGGLRFRPFRSLLLRASYSETFRSPTLPQLYGGVRESLVSSLPDLRRPQALTGDPVDASTYQRLVKTAGNRNLKPEDGITKQVGLVYDLPWKRLSGLSLDFAHGIIEQKNLITSGLGTTFIRQNELTSTGDLVIRDPQSETYTNTTTANINVLSGAAGASTPVRPGETVTVPGRIRYITDSAVNLAQQMVRYYDYGLRYRLRTREYGQFNLTSTWTYMGFYASRRFQNDAVVTSVGRSLPRYRGQSSIAWQRRTWGASLGMNYIHRYRSLRLDGWDVGRYYTFSGTLSYAFDKQSKLGDTRVTLGLENLLDRDPPLDNTNVGYNQGLVGRPGGRFGYLSVRKSL